MAQINARDWLFEVETAADTWAEVENVESFELNKAENEEVTETTHFGSDGHYEGQAMQRGASVQIDGKKLTEGPGQAAAEAWGEATGEDSLAGFRFRHKAQDEWTVWPEAFVSIGGQGGGNNDKTSWSATVTRSGKPTTEPAGA